MIKDKKMKHVYSDGEYDYYIFSPSVFQLYYKNEPITEIPSYRKTFSHKLRQLLYLFGAKYKILYLAQGENILGYIVFCSSRNWIVKGTDKRDVYTIFIYVYPKERKKGYSKKLLQYFLSNTNIPYRYSYKTIYDTNPDSIMSAKKMGYTFLYPIKKTKFLKTANKVETSNYGLYCYTNKKE